MALAKKKYPRTYGLLLPAGFLLGRRRGDAADSARRAGAGRVGTVAEPDPRGQAARREGGGHQRPIERKELSRLPAHPPAGGRLLRQIDLVGRAGRNLRRAVPRTRRPAGNGPRHRLDEIRRGADRPPQPDHAAAGRTGRLCATTTSCSWPAARRSRKRRWSLETFRTLSPQWPRLRLMLVPRHPDRFEAVAKLLDASGMPWQRRTALEQARAVAARWAAVQRRPTVRADPVAPSPRRILLVDVVGELGAWWGTAHIAFVGGSMGSRGGQNMIEPAAYGAAVSFGPNTWNFRDIVAAMLAHDAAVVVARRRASSRVRPPLPGTARLMPPNWVTGATLVLVSLVHGANAGAAGATCRTVRSARR